MTKQPSDVGSENYNRVMDGLEEIAEWTDEDFARAEIRKGGAIVRPERKRGELTLREKVLVTLTTSCDTRDEAEYAIVNITTLLEDTGSPAHMRVAAELRGE